MNRLLTNVLCTILVIRLPHQQHKDFAIIQLPIDTTKLSDLSRIFKIEAMEAVLWLIKVVYFILTHPVENSPLAPYLFFTCPGLEPGLTKI